MIRRLIIAVVLTSAIAPHPSVADDVDDLCSARWGADYVMRERCVKEQRAAKARLSQSPAEAIAEWRRARNVPSDYLQALKLGNTHRASLVYVGCVARAEQVKGGDPELLRCLELNDVPATR